MLEASGAILDAISEFQDVDWQLEHGKDFIFVFPNFRILTLESAKDGLWRICGVEAGMATSFNKPAPLELIPFVLKCMGFYPNEIRSISWKPIAVQVIAKPEPPLRPRGPSVYFIAPIDGGNIKIGWAYDPEKRLAQLLTGSPIRLEIVATIPGGQEKEALLHKQFTHLRSHGEWFRPGAELLSFIQEEATPWNK